MNSELLSESLRAGALNSSASQITRRTVLRGVGAMAALPFLESLTPAAEATRPPVRMAHLYFPNGVADGAWEAKKVGSSGQLLELNKWMKPLESLKEHLIIPRNMWTPRGNGHGAGTATWLTGHDYNHSRIDVGGISVDQLAAKHVGKATMLPSLELSVRGEGFFSKSLPRNNISWTSNRTPCSREIDPRKIFDRMFRDKESGFVDRSVLDLVLDDTKSLRNRVSTGDQRKVDEYLDSVRSIEKRLEFADQQAGRIGSNALLKQSMKRPGLEIPENHEAYMRLMMDMIVLAFWSGATRVSTFMLDHGQSNRYFNFIDGVRGTWHALSHYRDASGKTEDDDGKTSWSSVSQKRDQYNTVTLWHHKQVAYLLERMKNIDEGAGSLLDNSMIVYGSNLADGHEHSAKNLPLLIAGGGGGTIKTGRQVRFRRSTSMSNLHLSMLQRMGVRTEAFGGSKHPLTELEG